MEASKVLYRSLRLISIRAKTCRCKSTSVKRTPIAQSLHRRPLTEKQFSTSANWREPPPETQATASSTSSTPPVPSPKQELESYTLSLQKIIDGYKLKSGLPPRQYESFVVAVTNAEVRLNAPGAHPDSFAPLLKSLHGEIEPILKANLGSSNVAQLIAEVGNQKDIPTPQTAPAIASTEVQQPPKSPIQKISQRLDALMGNPKSSATASRPVPKPSEDSDLGPRSTLDTLYDHYRQQARNERSLASDPFNPTPPSDADLAEQTRRSANLSMQDRLQDRLARKDSYWLRNHRDPRDAPPTLRLKPALGRTVEVSGSFDVTRAFRNLEGLCSRNGVKSDFNKQRFHVRRGQMKKTLRRMRWRKMFAEGFLEECARVRRMRRQGW